MSNATIRSITPISNWRSVRRRTPPFRQGGFEILLGIAGVTAAACVPATGTHENAALNLDQRATSQVCEIGTPFPRWVEPEFALKGWSLRNPPKQVES